MNLAVGTRILRRVHCHALSSVLIIFFIVLCIKELLFAFFEMAKAGLGVVVSGIDHQRYIVELVYLVDGALIVFEAILLAGIEPLVLLDSELEGALRDVAPAYQLHHVVAERGCGSLELEAESLLIG